MSETFEQSGEQRQLATPETVIVLLSALQETVGQASSRPGRYAFAEFDSYLDVGDPARINVQYLSQKPGLYGEVARIGMRALPREGHSIPFEHMPFAHYCFHATAEGTTLVKVFNEPTQHLGTLQSRKSEHHIDPAQQGLGIPVTEIEAQGLLVLLQHRQPKSLFAHAERLPRPQSQMTVELRAGCTRMVRWLLKLLESIPPPYPPYF